MSRSDNQPALRSSGLPPDLAALLDRLRQAFPEARLERIENGSPSGQHSLQVDPGHAVVVATYLRDEPGLRFDFASNVTGVDWLDRIEKKKVKVQRSVDGEDKEFEDTIEVRHTGYLEAVYHLFSTELRHGPLVLRMRTGDRLGRARLPSLTPVWRSCEFQEREIYDLFGIIFEGHPDLRRILMWDEFEDYPMRKDYVEPDDYEYEPTPHGSVRERAERHLDGGGAS